MIEARRSVYFWRIYETSQMCASSQTSSSSKGLYYLETSRFKQIYSVKVTRYSTYYTQKPEANGAHILRCPLSQSVLRFTGIFKIFRTTRKRKKSKNGFTPGNQTPHLPHIRPCLSSLYSFLGSHGKTKGILEYSFRAKSMTVNFIFQ